MALRWGILGAGNIAHDFVIALRTLLQTEHTVTAVAARSLAAANKFATTHSIAQSYGSYDDLFTNPIVDIVYVSTIHVTHLPNAMKALDAGKPVLCEKPMTMNAHDTKALIDKAREKNLFLMEGDWTLFFPAVREVQRMIDQDDLGEVKYVRANFSFRRPPERAEGRLTDPKLGGGSIIDLGIYPVSLATMAFGGIRPEKIHVEGTLLDTGVDDMAAITLTYPGGGIAQLGCGISYDTTCSATVCGTKGDVKIPHPFWCPTKLVYPEGLYAKPPLNKVYPVPMPHMATNYPNSTGLRYEAEDVYKCLKEGKIESGIASHEHSLIVAEVCDEIMKQLGVIYYK